MDAICNIKKWGAGLVPCLLLLTSCYSIEPFAIDYMQPAGISFPPALRKVAVVNNTLPVSDSAVVVDKLNYYPGNAALATEVLAEAIAAENYFDEVVICDSALRYDDKIVRENILTLEEVNQLARDLGVDMLFSMEKVQIRAERKMTPIPNTDEHIATIDAKVGIGMRAYIPERRSPLLTLNLTDSIFWEGYAALSLDEKQLLEEASTFAGTMPVSHLLPTWETGPRYYFRGGSVNLRDGAVYAREGNWEEAIRLWQALYDSKKEGKQKMMAASNLALGHEMTGDINQAMEWAIKAQKIAQARKDKDDPLYYNLIMQYIVELQQRQEAMAQLHIQMQRFEGE